MTFLAMIVHVTFVDELLGAVSTLEGGFVEVLVQVAHIVVFVHEAHAADLTSEHWLIHVKQLDVTLQASFVLVRRYSTIPTFELSLIPGVGFLHGIVSGTSCFKLHAAILTRGIYFRC